MSKSWAISKKKITPLVGDTVHFLVEPDGNGYVMEILPKKRVGSPAHCERGSCFSCFLGERTRF